MRSRVDDPTYATLDLARQGLDFSQHLVVLRETADVVFTPDLRPVDVHVEHPAGAFDQTGVNVELFLDRLRQTGGRRLVVSLDAVFDGDVHVDNPLADARRHTG